MSIYYVKSGAAGSADGSSWTNAYTTLAAALTAHAGGNTFYVSHQHAESAGAGNTMTASATAATPDLIICVNDGAEPPTAVATTATITTTGNFAIIINGYAYFYGISFSAGTGASAGSHIQMGSTAGCRLTFDSCALAIASTHASPRLITGFAVNTSDKDGIIEWINTSVGFGNAAQGILYRGVPLVWKNKASAIAGTAPTTLFLPPSADHSGTVTVSGVDLSAIAGGNLVDVAQTNYTSFKFQDCKLHASTVIVTGTSIGVGGTAVEVINCDGADTNYRYFAHRPLLGEVFSETTIVRDLGCSDGTTRLARKMVSTANTGFYTPLAGEWIEFWDEATGAQTISIQIVTDNVTLTDAEAWIEVESLNTSGFPLSSITTDRAASILATPANQTTSTVGWTTTGLTTPVKQVLSAAITTAEKGIVRARVMLAKASTTLYYDPKISTSSGRQFMAG